MNHQDENELYDEIEKSEIVIFCLTDDYLKSEEFQLVLDFVKLKEKPYLYLLTEKINTNFASSGSFKVCDISGYDLSKELEGEPLYRLCYFVYSVLNSEHDLVTYENKTVHLKPINSGNKAKKHSFLVNEPLIKPAKLVANIRTNSEFLKSVAYVKHQEIYCILTNSLCKFYDRKFSPKHQFEHPKKAESEAFEYFAVLYDEKNRNIYLAYYFNKSSVFIEIYDEKMKMKKELCIQASSAEVQICNELIFIITDKMFIYDLNLGLLPILCPLKISKTGLVNMIIETRCSNYVYIVKDYGKTVRALNVNGFKYNDNITVYYNELSSFHVANSLAFVNNYSDQQIDVHEIQTNRVENPVSLKLAEYICKLNAYPQHLLKNPYLLPCGSLACLECIYENYNLYLNKFTCAACRGEHDNLKSELAESFAIESNLRAIGESQVSYLNEIIVGHYSNGKIIFILQQIFLFSFNLGKINMFENLFKFIEEEIEIRFESIKATIDELESILLKNIEKLELKLLRQQAKSEKRIKNLRFDCEEKRIRKKNIGVLLFDECARTRVSL